MSTGKLSFPRLKVPRKYVRPKERSISCILKTSSSGLWGKGITVNTIKDTWTKSRVRVEAGQGGGFGWGGVKGWGEKPDNCN